MLGIDLVAVDMILLAPAVGTRVFGLVLAVPTTISTYRAFRMARIALYDDHFVLRTFWRTHQIQWKDVNRFETWATPSGYGGKGYSIRAVLKSGRVIKFAEFWTPNKGSRHFPDCAAIVSELETFRKTVDRRDVGR